MLSMVVMVIMMAIVEIYDKNGDLFMNRYGDCVGSNDKEDEGEELYKRLWQL